MANWSSGPMRSNDIVTTRIGMCHRHRWHSCQQLRRQWEKEWPTMRKTVDLAAGTEALAAKSVVWVVCLAICNRTGISSSLCFTLLPLSLQITGVTPSAVSREPSSRPPYLQIDTGSGDGGDGKDIVIASFCRVRMANWSSGPMRSNDIVTTRIGMCHRHRWHSCQQLRRQWEKEWPTMRKTVDLAAGTEALAAKSVVWVVCLAICNRTGISSSLCFTLLPLSLQITGVTPSAVSREPSSRPPYLQIDTGSGDGGDGKDIVIASFCRVRMANWSSGPMRSNDIVTTRIGMCHRHRWHSCQQLRRQWEKEWPTMRKTVDLAAGTEALAAKSVVWVVCLAICNRTGISSSLCFTLLPLSLQITGVTPSAVSREPSSRPPYLQIDTGSGDGGDGKDIVIASFCRVRMANWSSGPMRSNDIVTTRIGMCHRHRWHSCQQLRRQWEKEWPTMRKTVDLAAGTEALAAKSVVWVVCLAICNRTGISSSLCFTLLPLSLQITGVTPSAVSREPSSRPPYLQIDTGSGDGGDGKDIVIASFCRVRMANWSSGPMRSNDIVTTRIGMCHRHRWHSCQQLRRQWEKEWPTMRKTVDLAAGTEALAAKSVVWVVCLAICNRTGISSSLCFTLLPLSLQITGVTPSAVSREPSSRPPYLQIDTGSGDGGDGKDIVIASFCRVRMANWSSGPMRSNDIVTTRIGMCHRHRWHSCQQLRRQWEKEWPTMRKTVDLAAGTEALAAKSVVWVVCLAICNRTGISSSLCFTLLPLSLQITGVTPSAVSREPSSRPPYLQIDTGSGDGGDGKDIVIASFCRVRMANWSSGPMRSNDIVTTRIGMCHRHRWHSCQQLRRQWEKEWPTMRKTVDLAAGTEALAAKSVVWVVCLAICNRTGISSSLCFTLLPLSLQITGVTPSAVSREPSSRPPYLQIDTGSGDGGDGKDIVIASFCRVRMANWSSGPMRSNDIVTTRIGMCHRHRWHSCQQLRRQWEKEWPTMRKTVDLAAGTEALAAKSVVWVVCLAICNRTGISSSLCFTLLPLSLQITGVTPSAVSREPSSRPPYLQIDTGSGDGGDGKDIVIASFCRVRMANWSSGPMRSNDIVTTRIGMCHRHRWHSCQQLRRQWEKEWPTMRKTVDLAAGTEALAAKSVVWVVCLAICNRTGISSSLCFTLLPLSLQITGVTPSAVSREPSSRPPYLQIDTGSGDGGDGKDIVIASFCRVRMANWSSGPMRSNDIVTTRIGMCHRHRWHSCQQLRRQWEKEWPTMRKTVDLAAGTEALAAKSVVWVVCLAICNRTGISSSLCFTLLPLSLQITGVTPSAVSREPSSRPPYLQIDTGSGDGGDGKDIVIASFCRVRMANWSSGPMRSNDIVTTRIGMCHRHRWHSCQQLRRQWEKEWPTMRKTVDLAAGTEALAAKSVVWVVCLAICNRTGISSSLCFTLLPLSLQITGVTPSAVSREPSSRPPYLQIDTGSGDGGDGKDIVIASFCRVRMANWSSGPMRSNDIVTTRIGMCHRHRWHSCQQLRRQWEKEWPTMRKTVDLAAGTEALAAKSVVWVVCLAICNRTGISSSLCFTLLPLSLQITGVTPSAVSREPSSRPPYLQIDTGSGDGGDGKDIVIASFCRVRMANWSSGPMRSNDIVTTRIGMCHRHRWHSCQQLRRQWEKEWPTMRKTVDLAAGTEVGGSRGGRLVMVMM
ncbi:hypothetical protein ECG_08236 [Echinococcus granulosus]|nr:hypothetical protein ECG_08236 [Echinococcus granulosus]